MYLGLRRKQISDTEIMDEFMHEITSVFPKLLIQFKDFASEKDFQYLDRYRHKYRIFNDDIQGTGAVVLAGFLNAAKTTLQPSDPVPGRWIGWRWHGDVVDDLLYVERVVEEDMVGRFAGVGV